MSEDASTASFESQEVVNLDPQINAVAENLNATTLSDNDSALVDSIPGTFIIVNNTYTVCHCLVCINSVSKKSNTNIIVIYVN